MIIHIKIDKRVVFALVMLVFVMTSLSITAGIYSSKYEIVSQTPDCITVRYTAKDGFKASDKYNAEIEIPIQPYNMRNAIFQDTSPLTQYKDFVFKTDDCVIDYYAHIKKDGCWSYVQKSANCKVVGDINKGFRVKGDKTKYDYLLYGKILFNATFDDVDHVKYSGKGRDAVATFKFCKSPVIEGGVKELSLSIFDRLNFILKDLVLRIREVFDL